MTDLDKFKVSTLTWDSDKDPTQFHLWIENMGCIVRTIKHGPELEDMLDSKLRRQKPLDTSIPAFLREDPDFAPENAYKPEPKGTTQPASPQSGVSHTTTHSERLLQVLKAKNDIDDLIAEINSKQDKASTDELVLVQLQREADRLADEVVQEQISDIRNAIPTRSGSTSHSSAHFTLGEHHTKYEALGDDVKILDMTLHNVLKMVVKGSKNMLLTSMTFPSYVQGVILLYKHMSMSRLQRMMSAFRAMDDLSFTGNVGLFQTQFVSVKRELDSCRADVNHYMICRLMEAFKGKSKTIQYKIAEDFNNIEEGQAVNLYDIVQKYCSELAAVGDGSVTSVNICTECNSPHHEVEDCPKRKQQQRDAENRDKHRKAIRKKKDKICDFCGKEGHIKKYCHSYFAALREYKDKGTPIPVNHVSTPYSTPLSSPQCEDTKPAAIDDILTGRASPSPQLSTSNINTGSFTPEAIQRLVTHVRSGRGITTVVLPSLTQPRESLSPTAIVRLAHACKNGSVNVLMAKPVPKGKERIQLSLCDGMGIGALATRLLGANITRFIGVEKNPKKRIISDNVNPPESSPFGGIDHSWHTDVFNITKEDIRDLGEGNISRLDIAAPCKDFSLSRLIPNYKFTTSDNPRPGLKGPHGQVLLKCIEITAWVLDYNPECEIFNENVVFDDLVEDWEIVNAVFGEPIILDAADYSYTRRKRAYWLRNFNLPANMEEMTAGFTAGQANDCLNTGRTAHPHQVEGKVTVRGIGASWGGNPDHPTASTGVPLLVDDVQFEKAQHITVEEAERLMGYPTDLTAGNGVTNRDRLRAIGDSWDLNVTLMLMRFSSLVTKIALGPYCDPSGIPQNSIITDPELAKAAWGGHPDNPSKPEDVLKELAENDLPAFVALIADWPRQDQIQALNLLRPISVNYAGSVLDSGSGRHISPDTHVTESDDTIPLSGFDSSIPSTWTQGSGYLPLVMKDANSDANVSIDITDADKLDCVVCPILSMGKMLRIGYSFELSDPKEMWAVSPDGQHRFRIELGDDDILRLPHDLRTGKDARPLPRQSGVLTNKDFKVGTPEPVLVARKPKDTNAETLHDIFCHCAAAKIQRTLEHTVGFKPEVVPEVECMVCAQTKARRRGLRQGSFTKDNAMLVTEQDNVPGTMILLNETGDLDDTYDDSDHESDDESTDPIKDIEYISPVIGRAMGQQPVPRFDLDKLRPFEAMFADNKDYLRYIRGGKKTAFFIYDMKSCASMKVDLVRKADNGLAFREIVATNGIHKLPYSCTIYTDGCGSMVHVEVAATLMGLNHVYIPPREQSLNIAEKVCLDMWDAAESFMLRAKAPPALFAYAHVYNCESWMEDTI